jgi:hypothetical protein
MEDEGKKLATAQDFRKILADLRDSWRSACMAFETASNTGAKGTAEHVSRIVTALSVEMNHLEDLTRTN